jgi:hypothetical protein
VIADQFIKHALRAKTVEVEVPISWKHGISHVDAVADGCGLELKSTSKTIPDDTHIRQVQRMMWAWADSGLPSLKAWGVILVNPVTYETSGPFQVHSSPRIREQISREIQATGETLDRIGAGADINDPATYLGLECSCGQCLATPTTRDASTEVDDLALTLEYLMEQKQDLDTEITAVKATISGLLAPGEKHQLNTLNGTVSKSQRRERTSIAWSKAVTAGIVPDTVVNAAIDAGYQTTTTTEPYIQLRVKPLAAGGVP